MNKYPVLLLLIVLAVLFSLCIYVNHVINTTTDRLIVSADACVSDPTKLPELFDLWEQSTLALEITVDHNKLSDIREAIYLLQNVDYSRDEDDLDELLQRICFLLRHLQEEHRFSFENIF